MKRIVCFLIAILPDIPSHASEATFSADGKTVYLSALFKDTDVHIIDVASKKHRTVTPIAAGGESIRALSCDAEGNILIATDRALHSWNPTTHKSQKVVDFPIKLIVSDLSCITAKGHPLKDTVLLLGESEAEDGIRKLLALQPGKKSWREIFCRRNDPLTAPRTNAAGRMFLGSNYDLWECNIFLEPYDLKDSRIMGSVSGCRIAPLAMMNTDSANSGAMAVRAAAPAGQTIYSLLSGRHMGAILATTAPASALYAGDEGTHPELAQQYDIMKQSLGQTTIVYEGGPCDALCVSESGNEKPIVFWRQNLEEERGWHIMRQGEKPQQIGTEPGE
jgi:WD40 repeat protein